MAEVTVIADYVKVAVKLPKSMRSNPGDTILRTLTALQYKQ